MLTKVTLGVFLIICAYTLPVVSFGAVSADRFQSAIDDSEIEGNVPPQNKFKEFLERDIRAYLLQTKRIDGASRISVALLRDAPTVGGIGFPHYYAWVTAEDKMGKKNIAGAIEVDAVARKSFNVKGFFTTDEVIREPAVLDEFFPQALHEIILVKALADSRRKVGI